MGSVQSAYQGLYIGEVVYGTFAMLALFCGQTGEYGRLYATGRRRIAPEKERMMINAKLGWVIMEMPMVAGMIPLSLLGPYGTTTESLVLLGLFQIHYLQRTLVFPLLMRNKGKKNPVYVVVLALLFNFINAPLQAFAISWIAPYPSDWLTSPQFIAGTVVFFIGLAINLHSDHITRNLRKPGEASEYKIPYGGFFRFVSSPNYFGEWIEWIGWGILTWSIGGLVFAYFTLCNLLPRAVANHRWYKEKFGDEYPSNRKAFFPFLL